MKQEEITLDGIKQYYVDVGKEEYKIETICDLYEVKCLIMTTLTMYIFMHECVLLQILSIAKSVIFCNTKRKV